MQVDLTLNQASHLDLSLPPSEAKSSVREACDDEGALRYAVAFDPAQSASVDAMEPVWLCVPGVPGSERDFRHLAPYLSLSAPVYRLTFPGFGLLAEVEGAPYTTQARARYIERVIQAEGWGQVRLIGHSMGGPASLMVASRTPSVVALGLVSSVGLRRHRAMRIGALGARLLALLLMSPILGSWLSRRGRARFLRAGFRGHPLHRAQLRLIIQHVIGINFSELMRCADALPSSVPTLCVWAKRDALIEESISEELASAISHAEVARLPQGGHNPQKYLPKALSALLCDTFDRDRSEDRGRA